MDGKAPEAFRSISEVAVELDLPQHVLRFWESRFHDIRPMKRGGGRRYYRPDDVNLLRGIRHLLYGEGYTIRGVQRILREQGAKFVQFVWQEGAPQPPHGTFEEADYAEEAESAAEMLEEEGGFGSRLASLIGRDFAGRDNRADERMEPALETAPQPRIEPVDRPIYRADELAMAPMQVSPHGRLTTAVRLARDDVRRLHSVLHELTECRKLIDAAAIRPE